MTDAHTYIYAYNRACSFKLATVQLRAASDDMTNGYDDELVEQVGENSQAIAVEGGNTAAAEGSSSALRVKKIGKKKGEKLRRKEQMRQYHEYMNQQREIRRQQEEILEEEFRRRKAEEAMRRADEEEWRKKAQAKRAKQEEKDRRKREQAEEKEQKKRRARFEKYCERIATAAQQQKICTTAGLSTQFGLPEQEVEQILRELCATSPEFSQSLWSGSTFMFVSDRDYERLSGYLKMNGKTSIKDAGADLLSILTQAEEE
ncbi:hypothetical protein BX666DRAFT_2003225 [Dichotomocladium elegans]|nr:hypothetical protein BX666DRAFT_2003225 [Dichotomocladium elegans]